MAGTAETKKEDDIMTIEKLCNRCNNPVEKSFLEEYSYQCIVCDEDLYEFETHEKVANSVDINRGIKCLSCEIVSSFGDWYGLSNDDFAICPECESTFTYDELLESADSEEAKKHIRDLQQG